ncbi:DUF1292 domain-containing protein [Syntrophomonas wolfei]|jgi:uncharacterized protein YrzB (UPF0473 family)|uniref:UPF0473 protein Swol_0471 n=1 Tax=Syntrophomonas wolfei subsp. wolfei (strain DSM 2245B / Goettingen) TaxID=335541 RepID=Q0AZP8_SYNWW|nr:DUF1292 domain-containing protein [Syntrophomonas wolfei]ABI67806.1 conserved hypothetical protein [Syntrophomonas wolfei subsp. wolfei str. Goettingen G311]
MTEEFLEEDFPILVLVDEDGIEHLFELLAELEIENDKYRVLVPLDEEDEEYDEEDGEVVILKVIIDEEGNELLSDIDDETEWEMVVEAWQELVDSEEL